MTAASFFLMLEKWPGRDDYLSGAFFVLETVLCEIPVLLISEVLPTMSISVSTMVNNSSACEVISSLADADSSAFAAVLWVILSTWETAVLTWFKPWDCSFEAEAISSIRWLTFSDISMFSLKLSRADFVSLTPLFPVSIVFCIRFAVSLAASALRRARFYDFFRNDSESGSRFACTSRFNCGIECKQVGLESNFINMCLGFGCTKRRLLLSTIYG